MPPPPTSLPPASVPKTSLRLRPPGFVGAASTRRTFSKRYPAVAVVLAFTSVSGVYLAFLSSHNAHPLEAPLPTPPTPSGLPGACSEEGQGISLLCLSLPQPSWGTLARASFPIQTRWRMGENRTFLTSLPPLSTASDSHPRRQEP